jgi:hypothetical protein
MKVLIWILFGVLGLLWTGTTLLVVELTQWAVGGLASGNLSAAAGAAVVQWPAWVTAWFDPALLRSLQEAALWATQTLSDALPWIGGALGWLVPVIWFIWGLGMLALLLAAGGSHLLTGWATGRLRTA